MRKIETNIRGRHIISYELCYPEDFKTEQLQQATGLIFSADKSSFIVSPAVSAGLQIVRQAQLTNNQIEHGYLRILAEEKVFTLKEDLIPLEGTDEGLSYEIYGKSYFEYSQTPSVLIPTEILDLIHSHTLNPEYESAVSDLFSGHDIRDMGRKFAHRYWIIGPFGRATCLINSGTQVFDTDFINPANRYQLTFNEGLTYAEALKEFNICLDKCKLKAYYSDDLINFHQAK